jgi:GT2 family glycosyltransferase
MSDSAITVVMVIKNRDKIRAQRNLTSLSEQTIPCNIILVDYGSDVENIMWERELVKQYSNINFIEVTRDTEHFNKSRALNIGFKQVKTKYILSTDIDCIFSNNFIEEVLRALTNNENAIVLCQKIDLDENGVEIEVHEPSASGTCIGINTNWINKVHGYDEFYTYWGREDNDLVDRAIQDGFNPIWITDKTKIWHQWHKYAIRPTLDDNVSYYDTPSKPIIRNENGWGEL